MISRRILGIFLIALATCAVTIKEIKNVTSSRQLLYSGTISLPSSDSSLFFLFYGIQGVTDRTQLANNPTLVVFGRYRSSYAVRLARAST